MPIAFLKPTGIVSDVGTNIASGLVTDIDEGVAGADGNLMVSVNNGWATDFLIQFSLEDLPDDADTINSFDMRVRARVDGRNDDTATWEWKLIGTNMELGGSALAYNHIDDGNGLLNRERSNAAGDATVANVNAALAQVQQTAFNQVMSPDGMNTSWDCFELEVDYEVTSGRTVNCTTEVLQLNENAATVNRTRLVIALTEVVELTENLATVIKGGDSRVVICVTEALLLATNAAAVNASRSVLGLVESLQLNENAAAVNRSRIVLAISEALLLAPNAAAVNRTRLVLALTEALELAENVATVLKSGPRVVNCVTEALLLATNASSVNRSRLVSALTEALLLTTNAAIVIHSDRIVNCLTEALLLTTQQGIVNRSRLVSALTEALVLTTNQAHVLAGIVARFIDYRYVKQSLPTSDTVRTLASSETKEAD